MEKNPQKMSVRENVFCHVYTLFSSDLGICGCGTPEPAYDLIRDLLAMAPTFGESKRLTELVGSAGARRLVLGQMESAGLIDHGFVIDHSNLTAKGEWYYKALHSIDDWSEFDTQENFAIGFPHDEEGCTEKCWKLPIFDRSSDDSESSSDNSPGE